MEFKFFPIGDIANFINGYAFKPEDWSEDGLKIIRIQNLTDPTKPYNKTQKKIDEKYLVKYDDVLVSWSATIDVFIWKQEEAYLNQHIFKVEFDKNKIIKQYFIFALKDTLQQLCKNAHGSTMKHIVKKDFDNHKIILPGITEQIKIAKILSWVEELIEDRKNSIDLLDDLLKSKFHEMFGNPIRNENKWELKLLKDICSKITDGTHDTPERLKKGVKFITGKHIRPFVIDFENSDYVTQEVHNEIYNRCNPEYGDILYTNIGVNLGTAAMNTVHYEFSMKNVALLKLSSSISSRFIEHLLNHPIFKEKISQDFSSGGAQKFLL
ncbi:MAG: restriction endonuclease subunit S, partial [Bacteroides intestinalis]|nr:restriction endonuclease subunit S [Bacteroides intestinalis]